MNKEDRPNFKHGKAGTRVYRIWDSMKSRCLRTNSKVYQAYGAVGKGLDDLRWLAFEHFYSDMGEPPTDKHTLDRIDNSKGYSKSNCRWATRREQVINSSHPRFLDFNGVRMCLREVASLCGVHEQTLATRLDRGYSIEEATQKKLLNVHRRVKKLTFNEMEYTVKEASELFGLPISRIYRRLKYGWSVDRVLTEPVLTKGEV